MSLPSGEGCVPRAMKRSFPERGRMCSPSEERGLSPLRTLQQSCYICKLKAHKTIRGSRGTASVASRLLPEQREKEGLGRRERDGYRPSLQNTFINGNL